MGQPQVLWTCCNNASPRSQERLFLMTSLNLNFFLSSLMPFPFILSLLYSGKKSFSRDLYETPWLHLPGVPRCHPGWWWERQTPFHLCRSCRWTFQGEGLSPPSPFLSKQLQLFLIREDSLASHILPSLHDFSISQKTSVLTPLCKQPLRCLATTKGSVCLY